MDIILAIETVKYSNWMEYIQSNVYTSLQTLNILEDKTYHLNKLLKILKTKSRHFHNIIRTNFVNQLSIRSIIGEIVCCLTDKIEL